MNQNRDLLFVQNQLHGNPAEAVAGIHKMLSRLETTNYLCGCVEIADLKKLKIIRKFHLVEQVLRQGALKPFQFVNNLN
jgi:isopentenyl diphosphate isomerase/L-lactate dehydrogenase-like FMN-dependent dehydrogenase